MRRTVIVTFAVLIVLALAWYGYGIGGDADTLRYSLEPVSRGDVESVVVTTGTLEALNTVVVGSQLSGQVAELHADFNDLVEADQLIARIDPRTFEARVRQNRADVKVAEASILQRQAEVVRSNAALAQASRELARRQSLKENGHISESELDADFTAVETADAQLKMAEAAVANADAVLEQRQAALSQAEVDLERTYIRSPVSGTVINRTVELGQTVAASLQAPELFQIAQDLHQMKVEASVDEADIGRISDGLLVRFSVDAYPERRFGGRVEQIRKAPDRVQNVVTYRVIIAAANDDLALLPGMTANVEVVLGRKAAVLKIPNAALRFRPKGAQAPASPVAGSGHGPGGGRGGAEALIARLSEVMELSESQLEQLESLTARQRSRFESAVQAARSGGADRQAMRETMQQLRANLNAGIAAILTDQQRVQFEQLLAERSSHDERSRAATIWMLVDGRPVSRTVRIGLADDDATEIVRGLVEGDEVIVRATRDAG